MGKLRKITLVAATLFATGAAASATIPGPQRALCPQCFGMMQIGDNTFIDKDEPQSSGALVADLEWSIKKVGDYFGDYQADPRILLCTDDDGICDRAFGTLGPRGITWGALLIRLNSKGLNRTIMAHELFHAELHRRMGHWGMLTNCIPMWFNEGLAVHISKDERFTETYSQDDMDWALRFQTFSDWGREVNETNWKRAYGASAARVAQLEEAIGRDGILKIIQQVTSNGVPFETALANASI